MPGKSKIEWTDTIWNPVTGCTKVSAGCLNCYAEMMTRRFQWDGPFVPWTVRAQQASGEPAVYLHYDRLEIPSHWRLPRRVFVNSMSDLFHPDVPDQFIALVFQEMARSPQHTFQVLTKRPERALEWFNQVQTFRPGWEHVVWLDRGVGLIGVQWPLPNVWMGVSVENAKALPRLDVLAEIPAAVRFVSAEPLLSPLDLRPWLAWKEFERSDGARGCDHCCGGDRCDERDHFSRAECPFCRGTGSLTPALDWVIVGGESGTGARPMHPSWPRDIRDQAQKAGVPFFFKQKGEWSWDESDVLATWVGPSPRTVCHIHRNGVVHDMGSLMLGDGALVRRIGRKAAGALLDGREHKEFPA